MTLTNRIYELELSLLTYETRQSVNALDGLLHDDFIEFGASGKTYNKSMVIEEESVPQKLDHLQESNLS
ncbi:MAG: nuclear transport factor 2 family protein [Proteobacteria bacterium]|nr:nuclear transport factor 2 family protein [Pseudomonadota bacterium]